MSRFSTIVKKALILQSLFFCLTSHAQSLYFEAPKPDAPLEDVQEFLIGVQDGAPSRMEFYLNGRLVRARAKAPFLFRIRWDANLENQVRVVAFFDQGDSVTLERTFKEIETDFQDAVLAFRCFPFLDKPPPEKWTFTSQGQVMEPQTFEPASRFPLSLVIALDISGSMQFDLPELSNNFHAFLSQSREAGYEIEFLLFDSTPRAIDPKASPEKLETLYNGEPKSVIWDTLATACGFFKDTPRRVVLLISDGHDDGSVHDFQSAALYFREKQAALIWLNPSTYQSRELTQLCGLSGGFRLDGKTAHNWDLLADRLAHQYYLLAPDAKPPINLKVSPGSAWFPEWAQ